MPPYQLGDVDLEALSGICGSISIACWVVVFSPQIIENFRRGSADGLSLLFLVVWLAGDVFNILGAVLQGVLPTMIILAVYYTLADIVLLGQCFYYRGFTLKDEPSPPDSPIEESVTNAPGTNNKSSERSALLSPKPNDHLYGTPSSSSQHNSKDASSPEPPQSPYSHAHAALSHSHSSHPTHRRHSATSFLHPGVDGTHLSPATPFIEREDYKSEPCPSRKISTLQSILFKTSAVALVCAAGILGWYVTPATSKHNYSKESTLSFDLWGQIFGYFCAVLYLGSRLPQILLNYRRKSTDGVSLLFFLFACIGNLTYVLSILAYSPACSWERDGRCPRGEAAAIYGRYILVNLSWLIGSFGTLVLDLCIFVQFFLYQGDQVYEEEEAAESRA